MYLSIESWIGTPDKISSKMRVRRSDFVSCATFSDLISIDVVLWITSFIFILLFLVFFIFGL